MTAQMLGLRKQRTRSHILADLSIHHVEGFVLRAGHSAHRLTPDYGYDLVVFTYNQDGYLEPGSIYIQVKAAESPHSVGSNYAFDVDIRDYNLWIIEEMPVILILFDAARSQAFWLCIQSYFSRSARRPRRGAKTVRVRIPDRNLVDGMAVADWRNLKGRIDR